jgi:hypothetical protein
MKIRILTYTTIHHLLTREFYCFLLLRKYNKIKCRIGETKNTKSGECKYALDKCSSPLMGKLFIHLQPDSPSRLKSNSYLLVVVVQYPTWKLGHPLGVLHRILVKTT